jgi:hypothetical protein
MRANVRPPICAVTSTVPAGSLNGGLRCLISGAWWRALSRIARITASMSGGFGTRLQ